LIFVHLLFEQVGKDTHSMGAGHLSGLARKKLVAASCSQFLGMCGDFVRIDFGD